MDDELLDVVDEHGRRLGTKRRGDVHRDGDWHLAFHLWVVGPGGVLLQRRAQAKASWPGRLDASAAGHLTAGESVADGLREVEEELGVTYRMDELHALGMHRVDEVANRELQHVFAVRDDRPLTAWTDFDRVELDGLVLVAHAAFAALVNGSPAPARSWDGTHAGDVTVGPGDLVPTPYLSALVPDLERVAATGPR
ncbi:NUDIX domain-containing protein [Baekduia soli]|uniref:NUDIX domain-containing protein n=1 Tax=Baekduia soli TaxID=496014 RepID=A0A5B8UBG4_9ACTN|nr:NUDIX domain-containing protein [Baekduia soli]QEC50496.1 NUDIX domain-containing protein [Baekduia soli]